MIPLTMTKTFGKLQKRLLLSCENSLRVRLKIFKYQRRVVRVVAQFRSGHGPIPVVFECYRIRTDSGMPRLDIRFSTSHLMMASTR